MEQKDLIIRLMKDDLIHQNLIYNFEAMGFYSDEYCLNLSDTIFKLLKIDDKNDELFEKYLERCSKVVNATNFRNLLNNYADEIYQEFKPHL